MIQGINSANDYKNNNLQAKVSYFLAKFIINLPQYKIHKVIDININIDERIDNTTTHMRIIISTIDIQFIYIKKY